MSTKSLSAPFDSFYFNMISIVVKIYHILNIHGVKARCADLVFLLFNTCNVQGVVGGPRWIIRLTIIFTFRNSKFLVQEVFVLKKVDDDSV